MTAPAGTEQDQQDTDDNDTGEAAATAEQLAEDAAKAKALGDKGQQAIDRMKAERNAAKAELASYKALGFDPEKLKEMIGRSEQDAAAAEAARLQREAEQAALSKANERLVKAEIKAAATGKLANPTLAAAYLAANGVDVSSFDVDDEGNVDQASIAAAIDDLMAKEPYLAAAQSDGKRFNGTADGGPKGSTGKPQLTKQDVERLSKEGKHSEIEQARKEGRLNNVLGIKPTT